MAKYRFPPFSPKNIFTKMTQNGLKWILNTTLKNAPGVYHAVLHYKPHTSIFKPTLWAEEMGDEWIVYPWEKSDSKAIQDYKI